MLTRAGILLLILSRAAVARTPASNWENVKMLAPGTGIRIVSGNLIGLGVGVAAGAAIGYGVGQAQGGGLTAVGGTGAGGILGLIGGTVTGLVWPTGGWRKIYAL